MNTSREAELLPVIQADRDAAARLYAEVQANEISGRAPSVKRKRSIGAIAAAFARQREALTTRIVGSGVEEIEEGRSPLAAGRAATASQPSREGVSGIAGIPNAGADE